MIPFIICRGIGFSPGSVKYIPTLGFSSQATLAPSGTAIIGYSAQVSTAAIIGKF